MGDYYVLDAKHNVLPEPDVIAWGKWFDTADRIVSRMVRDDVTISTVFLGVDHNFYPSGPPVLFETMVFGGVDDQRTWRYHTWEEAEAGHKALVALTFGEIE